MRIPACLAALVLALGLTALAQAPAKPKVVKMSMDMPGMQMPGQVVHEAGVPPFHAKPTAKEIAALPPTLDPQQFNDPRVRRAYAMAAQVRAVLYQQPCYCGCDKEAIHHKSLLDCFAGDHASICQTCMMEGVYTYEMTKQGKTPAQIRAAIESGAWRQINLNDLLLGGQVY